MRNSKTKGFTLVELIVVIAIIAILAAILVPNMLGYIRNSRFTQADANAKNVHTAATAAIAQAYADGKLGTATQNYKMFKVSGKDTTEKLNLVVDLETLKKKSANATKTNKVDLKTGLGEDFVGYGYFWVNDQSVSVTHAAWCSKNITLSNTKAADNVVCLERNKSLETDIVGWFPTPVDLDGNTASKYGKPGSNASST